MWLSESRLSFAIFAWSAVLGTTLLIQRESLKRCSLWVSLILLSRALDLAELFSTLFITLTARTRKYLKGCLLLVTAALSLCLLVGYGREPKWSVLGMIFTIVYVLLSIGAPVLYIIKWVYKSRRRTALKKTPVIKRRFGKEIRLPSIAVSTELRHLRTKTDFVINGVVYIRKGETVELLRTIGSYYSVRNSTGTEYIVPKANFF
ncbi:hypothetical protein NEHOM01_0538 [Nematocida homosporus]|uniref:uncharacterized protein n=1 Tax=Nematocida homosporus TaxID=1912981 RepID=UPI00221F8536|nr:uncharacterized protein NEHOM01_0538 [Nematocida homosporus]KAI5184987.1 hypothetical protein NEHOM01_0538 [Nematocida homosporus]